MFALIKALGGKAELSVLSGYQLCSFHAQVIFLTESKGVGFVWHCILVAGGHGRNMSVLSALEEEEEPEVGGRGVKCVGGGGLWRDRTGKAYGNICSQLLCTFA